MQKYFAEDLPALTEVTRNAPDESTTASLTELASRAIARSLRVLPE